MSGDKYRISVFFILCRKCNWLWIKKFNWIQSHDSASDLLSSILFFSSFVYLFLPFFPRTALSGYVSCDECHDKLVYIYFHLIFSRQSPNFFPNIFLLFPSNNENRPKMEGRSWIMLEPNWSDGRRNRRRNGANMLLWNVDLIDEVDASTEFVKRPWKLPNLWPLLASIKTLFCAPTTLLPFFFFFSFFLLCWAVFRPPEFGV